MMKKIFDNVKWGMIGCGDVAEIKSGPAFDLVEGSSLIAVMRRDGKLARDYAQRHGVPKWYDDADKLINDPDINAVYIATPPSTHKEFTLKAAAAGKPIYVEKPMALNHKECLEMIAFCEKVKVPLFTALYRRCLPRFLKIKSLIEEGKVGKVGSVNVLFSEIPRKIDIDKEYNWRVIPEIAGGGYFCDLAPHMLDILQYYLGDIVEANGFSQNMGKLYAAEDMVTGTFRFGSGVLGTGIWNFNSFENCDRTEIVGDKGEIIFSTFDESPIVLKTVDGIEEFLILNPKHIQQPLIQSIVDELMGKGVCPSTGNTAAKSSYVMDSFLNNK